MSNEARNPIDGREVGHFKLHRKFQSNFLWEEPREFSKFEAWLDMLVSARYSEEPDEAFIRSKRFLCERGQCLYSLKTWARRWGWKPLRVQRYFKALQKINMIRYENETVTVRITIINYDKYNPMQANNETKPKRLRNGYETVVKTAEEGNKEKGNNDYRSTPLSSGDDVSLSLDQEFDEFITAWNAMAQSCGLATCTKTANRFKAFRRKMKDPSFANNWRQAIPLIPKSDWLMGNNDRGWKADVAWFLRVTHDTPLQVVEGKYSNKAKENPRSQFDGWDKYLPEENQQ